MTVNVGDWRERFVRSYDTEFQEWLDAVGSSPHGQERQAQVRNWRRLLEIASELECPLVNPEFSGDASRPVQCGHASYRPFEEFTPTFEKYGIALNMEAYSYDFTERNDDAVQVIGGLNKPWVNWVDARIHQHNEIGNGDVDWDEFFATLRERNFDGIATVCVFGWEEEADALHRRMRERVAAELKA
jgi:myo-inositol catabolism protein IolH